MRILAQLEGEVKLYLDDLRTAGHGWRQARTYEAAITSLESGFVEEISLDHDLADAHYGGDYSERTGYHVCLWMAENDVWPAVVRIHSANSVGRENMASVVRRYAPSSTRLEMMPPGWRPEQD